jgi:hypothetical protein
MYWSLLKNIEESFEESFEERMLAPLSLGESGDLHKIRSECSVFGRGSLGAPYRKSSSSYGGSSTYRGGSSSYGGSSSLGGKSAIGLFFSVIGCSLMCCLKIWCKKQGKNFHLDTCLR